MVLAAAAEEPHHYFEAASDVGMAVDLQATVLDEHLETPWSGSGQLVVVGGRSEVCCCTAVTTPHLGSRG